MKKWKRAMAVLLSCSLMGGQLLTCYGADGTQSLESYIDEGNVVEEDLAGYVATGPAVDIDYTGEHFPVPYIAVVDDAFVAICAVIFAACGIVVNGDNLRSLASDFYNWLSYHADQYATAWKAAVTAGTLGVGAAIKGIGSLINAAKAYCLTIKGYGTSAKTYALPAVGSAPQYYYPTPSMLKSWNDDSKYSFSYRTPIDKYGRFTISDYFFPHTPLFGVGSGSSVSLYCISHNSNGIPFPYSIDRYHIASTEYFKGYGKTTFSTPTYGSIPRDIFVDCLKLPIFSTETTLAYYLETGSLMHPEDILYNPTGLSISLRPIVDAQTKTADVSDDIEVVIPSIDDIVSALADVIDADDIADRLSRTITDFAWSIAPDIVIPTVVPIPSESVSASASESAGEDTSDPYLPWVPDITGRLDGLLGGLKGIADGLAGFGEQVQALPGSIAQAISDVVIGTPDSSFAIDSIIVDKFPFCIPYDLVSCVTVLQAESTPPVWKVPFVIDSLNFRYEITLDLTQWTQVIAVIRGFLLLMFIVGLVILTRTLIRG